ncbi:MAG: Na+/H+ antiporter NhaA [Myxococcota bacterium]|nr:Na+/H+ antiporter NhaA [Myxococcota bacterium]
MSESQGHNQGGVVNFLQEFSIPLIAGVIAALILANTEEHLYHEIIHFKPFGDVKIFGHGLDIHFLINDIFMVLFFGIAAKEITEAMLPGGALNPPAKAINPLLGTIGGVVGPAGMYFLMTWVFYTGTPEYSIVANGWGIPTATDIALAWLVARIVFGKAHPAVNFLLLLAVADDAIGLGIIAVFYPNPEHPVDPAYLLINLAAMGLAYGLRRAEVQRWSPYIFLAGGASWVGLILASLHPALALVLIVPFMPAPKTDTGLFATMDDVAEAQEESTGHHTDSGHGHSPLHNFEHDVKLFVDFGLFFFAFANAGVALASVNEVTWIVLAALIVGKTIGITGFAMAGTAAGFPLPDGMKAKHLVVAGLIAGIGLTVALFVAGEAFPSSNESAAIFQGPARMGAVLSGLVAFMALALGRLLGVKDGPEQD